MGARASGKHRWLERREIHRVEFLEVDQVLLTKQARSRLVLESQIVDPSTVLQTAGIRFRRCAHMGAFDVPIGVASAQIPLAGVQVSKA